MPSIPRSKPKYEIDFDKLTPEQQLNRTGLLFAIWKQVFSVEAGTEAESGSNLPTPPALPLTGGAA